jgi:endoglucanase
MANIELIKKVTLTPGISGREKEIREIIKEIAAPYADSVTTDNLGNLIVLKKANNNLNLKNPKKVMFAAHMDEIGFIVTFIDDKGMIRVSNIGGINWFSAAYTTVVFGNGTKGVIVPETGTGGGDYNGGKFYVDIGGVDKETTEKYVKVGDYAVVEPRIDVLCGNKIAGRPLDDRIGCAVMLEALINSAQADIANDIYYVFTAQEEVGCRGSKTAAYNIMPDYAVAFDVTGTGDTIGARPMAVALGGGAAVKVKDSSVLCDIGFVELLSKLAESNNIKYQLEVLEAGGTDTSSMQMSAGGCIAGAISIPTRFIHSSVEMIDLADYDACIALAVKLIGERLP